MQWKGFHPVRDVTYEPRRLLDAETLAQAVRPAEEQHDAQAELDEISFAAMSTTMRNLAHAVRFRRGEKASMPFYAAGFGSMCLAAGSDRAGCRLRIESTDPSLFAPERDAKLLAAEAYARDNPLRFTEASDYYDLMGEDGARWRGAWG